MFLDKFKKKEISAPRPPGRVLPPPWDFFGFFTRFRPFWVDLDEKKNFPWGAADPALGEKKPKKNS